MALGIVLVRCGIVRSQDSKVLKLDGVEETSLIYSNAGNLIIPIVTAILGKEWVIYTSAFLSVQLFLLWSHAKMKLCGEKGIDLKKILTNINMIAIFAGVLLFLLRIQLPAPVQDAVDSISSMVGPMGMLILGMLIAEMDLKKLLSYHRLWWITLLRLVGIPLIGIVLLKYSTSAGGQNNTAGYTACHLHAVRVHTDPDGAGVRQRCRLRQRDQCGNDPVVYRHDAADGGIVPDVSTCERSAILAPAQAAIKNPRK